MADDQHPKNPESDPLAGTDPIAVSETEVDGVFEKAALQLDELAREIGVAEPPKRQLAGPAVGPAEPETPDVDRQLKELDGLLRSAGRELGPMAASSPPSNLPEPGESPTNPPVEIPDFMRELTQTEPVGAAQKSVRSGNDAMPLPTPNSLPGQVPDFMAELTAPEVQAPMVPQPPTPKSPRPDLAPIPSGNPAPMPRSESQFAEPSHQGRPEPLPMAAQDRPSEPPSSGGVLTGAGEFGIRGLEVLDRWTAWIGPTVRSVIGWLAIFMLVGAIIVLVMTR